jgi:hypothetical protein
MPPTELAAAMMKPPSPSVPSAAWPKPLVAESKATSESIPPQDVEYAGKIDRMIIPLPRTGIGGHIEQAVSAVRDALAGKTSPQFARDAQGNLYVEDKPMTRTAKWVKIASMAAQGAAAGLAAGRGAGNMGRAGLAGIEVGERTAERAQQQRKEMTEEARAENLDKFNSRMRDLEMNAKDFEFTRLKIKATQDDINFGNSQTTFVKSLGGVLMNTYPDAFTITDVAKQNPQVWADYIAGKVMVTPAFADGKRAGLSVWQLPKSDKDIIVNPGDPGASVWNLQFAGMDKPAKLVEEKITSPMTLRDINDHNNSQRSNYSDIVKQQQEEKEAPAKLANLQAEAKLKRADTTKAIAEAAESAEKTRKLKIENDGAAAMDDNASADELAEMLLDGRASPSLIKNRKNYQAALALADRKSIQHTGQGFDANLSEAMYGAYKDGVKDYTSGNTAKGIKSFDKFLGHALEASKAINGLRNTDVRLVNAPLNKLSLLAGGKHSNEVTAFMQDLEAARSEWQAFLANNKTPTDKDREVGELLASKDAKPSDIQAALKEWAKTAAVRIRAEDFGFLRLTRNRAHLSQPLSDQGIEALQHFGVDPNSVYATAPPPSQMVGPGANVLPNQPAPGGNTGGQIIQIGDKFYKYKGSGASDDLNNYTEVKRGR